ncbi:MAG: hypothetical protein LLG05_18965 [Porphyromonadaceae bacterium]|nr:hypothetical protein [Porphyromonadaceae bacterium]
MEEKIRELILIYRNLLAQIKDMPVTGVTTGKTRIIEMIISDLEDLT